MRHKPVLLLACLLGAQYSTVRARCQIKWDSDFPGHDLVTLSRLDPLSGYDGSIESCAESCFRFPQCQGWSTRPANSSAEDAGNCYLKSKLSHRAVADGRVSGLPCCSCSSESDGIARKSSTGDLHPPLLNNLIWSGNIVMNDSIWVVSIGSKSRPEYQEVQRRTIGRHFKLFTFNEMTVMPCKLCLPGKTGIPSPTIYMKKWLEKPEGWWCAQKRILPALQTVLSDHPAKQFPAFLFIIDDDTFVNPPLLQKFVARLNPGVPLYTGEGGGRDVLKGFPADQPYISGGGGALLSRATLMLLNGAAIQQCIDNIQQGIWCDWHSDWTLAECIRVMAGLPPTDAEGGQFNQYYGLKVCNREAITCHENITAADMTKLSKDRNLV